jgi:dihydrofolate reductase
VATVRQYLRAGLIDSLHIVSAPALLGQGESLFDGLDIHALGFSLTERKTSEYATHLVLEKSLETELPTMASSRVAPRDEDARHKH